METTSLTITLPKSISRALERKAKQSGKGVEEYIEKLIANQVTGPSFRELFGDVRDSINISDDDLETQVVSALNKVRSIQIS